MNEPSPPPSTLSGAVQGPPNARVVVVLHRVSVVLGVAVAVVGALVVVGWVARVPRLRSVGSSLVSMKLNTAVCFIALGAVIGFARSRVGRLVSGPALTMVIVVGLLTFLEHAAGLSFGIDDPFGLDVGGVQTSTPGRMAPTTAAALVLLATAAWSFGRRRWALGQALALSGGAVGLLALVGYVYGVTSLYRVSVYTSMALNTALSVVAAGIGLVLVHPDRGFIALATEASAGGVTLRRVLPPALVTPVMAGGAAAAAVQAEVFEAPFALALTVLVVMAVTAALIWFNSSRLRHVDLQRAGAERALEGERAVAERLRELDELKNEFLGIVAHDLKNPLAAIALLSEQLRRDDAAFDADLRRDLASRVARNTDHLIRLVDDLLQVSQIESGRMSFERAAFDLGAQVRAMVAEQRSLYETVKLEADVPAGLPCAFGDMRRNLQVLTNLVSNGAKFSPPGERVVVRVRATGDGRLEVAVRDRGPGIAAEHLPRLFRKFSRIPNSDPSVKGTGLGLYICKAIVEAQGGDIDVETAPGAGSTFRYTIPSEAC